MYKDHQAEIEQYAWQSPEHIADVLLFVRLSIRRHFFRVYDVIQDVHERGIEAMPTSQDKKFFDVLTRSAVDIHRNYRVYGKDLFTQVLQIPGFGIPKAGFVCQLLSGTYGCLDSHNLKRFGLKANQFRSDGSWLSVERRIELYGVICLTFGSEYLWNSWCQNLALLYPARFEDAEEVSALHMRCIIR